MLVHLADFVPPLFNSIGEQQMRKAIDFGIARAARHGFTNRGPVRFYLELTMLLGCHFDTDPQYPWATEILGDDDPDSQMDRAERLYEKTRDYRRSVAGPDDHYTRAALENIAFFARHPLALSVDRYVPDLLQQIALIYPQKADYVGDAALEALIRAGVATAQRNRCSTVCDTTLLIMLMLAFGHGCTSDFLFPWIEKCLEGKATADPHARFEQLEQEALRWIAYLLNSPRTVSRQ